MYTVTYFWQQFDDAYSRNLGVFTDEVSAQRRAIQAYVEELTSWVDDEAKLERILRRRFLDVMHLNRSEFWKFYDQFGYESGVLSALQGLAESYLDGSDTTFKIEIEEFKPTSNTWSLRDAFLHEQKLKQIQSFDGIRKLLTAIPVGSNGRSTSIDLTQLSAKIPTEISISEVLWLRDVYGIPIYFDGHFQEVFAVPIARERTLELQKLNESMVEISTFSISKFLVTQSLWTSVVGHNPSAIIGSQRPVESISWLDCVAFCNVLSKLEGRTPVYVGLDAYEIGQEWDDVDEENYSSKAQDLMKSVCIEEHADGYRLPTREEWSFVDTDEYVKGFDSDKHGWDEYNSAYMTRPVGEKLSNSFGLFDLYGNVSELCVTKSVGTDTSIVNEIFCTDTNCETRFYVRCHDRFRSRSPNERLYYVGFRLVRNT